MAMTNPNDTAPRPGFARPHVRTDAREVRHGVPERIGGRAHRQDANEEPDIAKRLAAIEKRLAALEGEDEDLDLEEEAPEVEEEPHDDGGRRGRRDGGRHTAVRPPFEEKWRR